jgi:hypothetical protein
MEGRYGFLLFVELVETLWQLVNNIIVFQFTVLRLAPRFAGYGGNKGG